MDVKTATAWWSLLRDVLLFLTGAGLLVHEATQYVGPERRWVYLVAAGIGFSPFFTRKGDRGDAPRGTRSPGEETPT